MSSSSPVSPSETQLIDAARAAMQQAYCPYSRFQVGAALLTTDNKIISGCNVENASYGGTICAERSALASAVSQGHRRFKAIAIVTALAEPATPCGICRQFMVEFGDYKVILVSTASTVQRVTSVSELLPGAFTPQSLQDFTDQTTNA